MRTAQDYLNGYKRLIDSEYYVNAEDFKTAINEARKEAIKKCANKIHGTVYNGNGDEMQDYYKQLILKLIDELK